MPREQQKAPPALLLFLLSFIGLSTDIFISFCSCLFVAPEAGKSGKEAD